MNSLVDHFFILDVKISKVTLTKAFEVISRFIKKRTKEYICVAPVSTIMACQDDLQYRDIVNQASMVTPDGMPVVWIAHAKGYKDVERTYGPELMAKVLDQGRKQDFKHFFYGGSEEVLDQLTNILSDRYPGVNIVGKFSPPLIEKDTIENREVITNINDLEPDIIWVGLGSPKQDYWMAHHRFRIKAPVMIGVGAAFDFLAGYKPQAPKWMQSIGLEWLFRLLSEPQRLWRRYLIGNTRFVYLLLKRLIIQKSLG